MIAIGLLLGVMGMFQFVAGIVDGFESHRIDTAAAAAIDLDEGTWLVYERVDGFGFLTLAPGEVRVLDQDGRLLPVYEPRFDETTTRGAAEYQAVARFEVEEAGVHEFSIDHESEFGGPRTEVLIGRSITDVFARWPWLLVSVAGGLAVIVGIVLAIVGYSHRKAVRGAGQLA